MFSKITSAPKKVVTHVYTRRGRYCAATGIIAGAYVMRQNDNRTLALTLAFIEEKGLTNELFTPEML